jgi:hypothetical protein
LLAIKNLGLDLANGTFKTDYGRGMSVVSFDAKNNSGSIVTNLRFALHIVNEFNNVTGGQSWCSSESIPAGETRHFSTYLPQAFNTETSLVVNVLKASSGNLIFDVPARLLKKTIETQQFGVAITAEQTTVADEDGPNLLCDPTWCQFCRINPAEDCPNGIKTFSCSISTCTCSYTCK